ncbi:MAG TPA: hypothetical protein VGS58_12970 [Candidatus Sulfopaludibacter sp.]|nr:hypothetical protein [Candidatus Sulfopaludibacter sp.]
MPTATITYYLTQDGQKAAIAAGLPGNHDQTISVEVGPTDLDLFTVSGSGALSAQINERFDAPLTTETALPALRAYRLSQAEYAAERKAAAEAERTARAAREAEERAAAVKRLREAVETGVIPPHWCRQPGRIEVCAFAGGLSHTLRPSDTDEDAAALVVAALALHKSAVDAANAAAAVEKQHAELVKSLPVMPAMRPAAVTPSGEYAITVPNLGEGAWAKRVDSVDSTETDGTAFEGAWLRCGTQTALSEGDVIVAGSKKWAGSRHRGEFVKTRNLYLVSRAGLVQTSPNTPAHAAELLAMDPQERIQAVCANRLAQIDERLAELVAAEARSDVPEQFRAEFDAAISERRETWSAHRTALASALESLTAPLPINTVEAAAAAIISAGYKALSLAHHPDKGGDARIMALLTDARNQLRELLTLATEQTGGAQ